MPLENDGDAILDFFVCRICIGCRLFKVLINPNTILLIWILCNANSWMPKYFLIWTFICCYIEVCISKMVMRWRLCRHNLHTQCSVTGEILPNSHINGILEYSIFYFFFFTPKSSSGLLYEMEERNRNAYIDVILITILEIQTSIWH